MYGVFASAGDESLADSTPPSSSTTTPTCSLASAAVPDSFVAGCDGPPSGEEHAWMDTERKPVVRELTGW